MLILVDKICIRQIFLQFFWNSVWVKTTPVILSGGNKDPMYILSRFMGQICKCKHFCGLFASHSFTNFINEHISGGATPVLIHLFMSQLHYIFRRWPRLLRKCLFFQLLQRLILFETALQLLLRKSLQWVQNIILLQINLYNEDCHEKFWKSVFSSI